MKKLGKDNLDLLNKQNKILNELHKLYIDYHTQLDYFHDELKILKEKIDALTLMKSSSSFSILECWLPEKNMQQFKNILEKETDGHYTEYHERKDAPTLLNNPQIIKPFETITELYSLPKYKDFDPTPILAISFSFFFGFMLTDFLLVSLKRDYF